MIARLAYVALFVVALPLLLAGWARALDARLELPALRAPLLGWSLAAAGVLAMLAATRDLWRFGHGLPASPYPPRRLVTRGLYAVVRDPIYVGAVLAIAGASIATGSAAGLWIVVPVLAASCTAWVWGFERETTRRRYGTTAEPLLHLPYDEPGYPSTSDRVGTVWLVLLPWLLAFMAVEWLGDGGRGVSVVLPLDARVPVVPWTEGLYAFTYLWVPLAVFVAHDRRVLARFARDGLWATALIVPFYLIMPMVAEAKPVPPGDGVWHALMRLERRYDAPVTAFPAFHVVWVCLAARVWIARWPRVRALWLALAIAQVAATVTTGMHAILDVLGGLAAWRVVESRHAIWDTMRRSAEGVANSGAEVMVGPLRFAKHGVHTGVGAAVGVAVGLVLAGPALHGWLLGIVVACVVGASLWAQVVEGSPQLLRPYGYYGSVVTTIILVPLAGALGANGWLLGAAFAVGAAFAQAIGRLRCLVNGCCHGRPTSPAIGVRVTNPLSRVVRLAKFGGVPIHATQVYSMVSLLVIGVILLRLWSLRAPLAFVLGSYFILTGLTRFVEEHYRGEPQTAEIAGLRLYQWLAIGAVVGGAVVTAIPSPPAPLPSLPGLEVVTYALVAGLFCYVAFGVDWPASDRRFSRLR